MTILRLIATMLALAIPALALAADHEAGSDRLRFSTASGTDWTGASIGVALGWVDIETSGAATLEGDDVLLGFRAAYDFDFGDVVAGVTFAYDVTDVELGSSGVSADDVTRLGGRVGFDAGRNWFYLAAGWARVSTDSPNFGDSDGYFAGLGYEVFLWPNVTAGMEFLYHSFDDFNFTGLDADATSLALSLNYRF